MRRESCSKFIKYSNLNEISKFSNFNNLFLLSGIKSVSVWFSIDLSSEKSKLLYYSKGLLGIFLIYFITNKYPVIKSSKDQRILHVESNLYSSDLICFLEKFLIIYSSKQRKNIVKEVIVHGDFIRFLVIDFNFFKELDGFINVFGLLEWLSIDIYCNHDDSSRNLLFLDNLFKSSYLI